jgi:hypothetical protein
MTSTALAMGSTVEIRNWLLRCSLYAWYRRFVVGFFIATGAHSRLLQLLLIPHALQLRSQTVSEQSLPGLCSTTLVCQDLQQSLH